MKNRSGISPSLKKLNTNAVKLAKRQFAKIFTLSFWKKTAFAGFVAMACVGSYVTLKSFSFTKSAIETVEKPVVRAWSAFTDDSYKPKANSKVSSKSKSKSKSKTYSKSSQKSKKSKYTSKRKSNKSSKYAHKNRSSKKKSGKVLRSSYKYAHK